MGEQMWILLFLHVILYVIYVDAGDVIDKCSGKKQKAEDARERIRKQQEHVEMQKHRTQINAARKKENDQFENFMKNHLCIDSKTEEEHDAAADKWIETQKRLVAVIEKDDGLDLKVDIENPHYAIKDFMENYPRPTCNNKEAILNRVNSKLDEVIFHFPALKFAGTQCEELQKRLQWELSTEEYQHWFVHPGFVQLGKMENREDGAKHVCVVGKETYMAMVEKIFDQTISLKRTSRPTQKRSNTDFGMIYHISRERFFTNLKSLVSELHHYQYRSYRGMYFLLTEEYESSSNWVLAQILNVWQEVSKNEPEKSEYLQNIRLITYDTLTRNNGVNEGKDSGDRDILEVLSSTDAHSTVVFFEDAAFSGGQIVQACDNLYSDVVGCRYARNNIKFIAVFPFALDKGLQFANENAIRRELCAKLFNIETFGSKRFYFDHKIADCNSLGSFVGIMLQPTNVYPPYKNIETFKDHESKTLFNKKNENPDETQYNYDSDDDSNNNN